MINLIIDIMCGFIYGADIGLYLRNTWSLYSEGVALFVVGVVFVIFTGMALSGFVKEGE